MLNDDIFGFNQTPEDKFYEILCTMNKNIMRDEMHALFKRMVVMEEMLNDEDLDKKVLAFEYGDQQKMEQLMQNFYLHVTANMIGQHE